MRMQFHTTKVDDPGEARRVVHHDLLGGVAGGEREGDSSEPIGPIRGSALLIKRFALRAVHKTLQHNRAVANARQSAWRYRQVVAHQVELAQLHLLRKVELAGVRN